MPRRPSAGNIASPYGPRTHPVTGRWQATHTGEDIGWLAGLAIVAPLDCLVVSYGPTGGYGNRLVLVGWFAGQRVEVWLCHLAAAHVLPGAEVYEGTHVATMGATGTATGVHLHWEVRLDGVRVNPADWLTMVAAHTAVPLPTPTAPPLPPPPDPEEADMAKTIQIHYTENGKTQRALVTPGTGYFAHWTETGATIANRLARALDTGDSVEVTRSMFEMLRRAAAEQQPARPAAAPS